MNDIIYIKYSGHSQYIIDAQCFYFSFLVIYFFPRIKINIKNFKEYRHMEIVPESGKTLDKIHF